MVSTDPAVRITTMTIMALEAVTKDKWNPFSRI
jgi:hypothetical protein